jgi:VanZ family protein
VVGVPTRFRILLFSAQVKVLEPSSAHSPQRKILALLCLLVTFGILLCTLWPFNPFPPNRVSWLPQSDGIRFAQRGVALTPRAFQLPPHLSGDDPGTLELWIKPARTDSVSTILNFYTPRNPYSFLLRQYHGGLIVNRDIPMPLRKPRHSKIDIDDGLQQDQLTLITITSSGVGTRVYFDGKLKKSFPGFHITLADLSGQLVLGSATVQPDSWSGEIHGLAIDPRELNPQEVLESNRRWTVGEPPDASAIASYTFTERAGNIVHAQGIAPQDLYIPKIYRVPHHSFLTPPWREFDPSWDYVWDVLRNIVGFMPLGFLLCALLYRAPRFPRAVLLSTLLGGTLSLCIEILQAYIPQRGSGMTDVITNTLGTLLGALLLTFSIRSKLTSAAKTSAVN